MLKGKSGVEHSFTIVASYRGSPSKSELVVIDAISSPTRVSTPAVISLFGKSVDCRVKKRILIALPELDLDAKVFARNYNISFIEAPHHLTKDVVTNLQKILESESCPSDDSVKVSLNEGSFSQTKQTSSKLARKRNSLDIMADILKVANDASGKTEIMACANLSYDQCQKYIPALEKLGLLSESSQDGIHFRFAMTEKGREFLSSLSGEFGRIADGDETVWKTRRRDHASGLKGLDKR